MVYDMMVSKLYREKKNRGKYYYSPSPLTVVVNEASVGGRGVCKDSLLVVPSLIR